MLRKRTRPTPTRGDLRVLAVLLLADGRCVSSATLAQFALPWHGATATVWTHWIPPLRRRGCQIRSAHNVGYWLAALPPDDLLDDVLVMVHELRREYPRQDWLSLGRPLPLMTRSQVRAARRLSA